MKVERKLIHRLGKTDSIFPKIMQNHVECLMLPNSWSASDRGTGTGTQFASWENLDRESFFRYGFWEHNSSQRNSC